MNEQDIFIAQGTLEEVQNEMRKFFEQNRYHEVSCMTQTWDSENNQLTLTTVFKIIE